MAAVDPPTDYFITDNYGTVHPVAGVVSIERLPEDPTLANTDPLTKAFLFADGHYRNNQWLGVPGTAFQSADDGDAPSPGATARMPDDVMKEPLRNKVELHSCYVLTTGSGAFFEFKCAKVRGMSTSPPTLA